MMLELRTTLTLEDDIARLLQEEARRPGQALPKPFVNEALRRGLAPQASDRSMTYRVKVHGRSTPSRV